jgi:non-heme chloroperoxidase
VVLHAAHKTASSLDGTRIAYRVLGTGARAVVLVHGWMTSGAVFAEVLEAWQPQGCRVIVPDLRGSGDSEAARDGYALERYREDVLAVLDAEHVGRAVLVGHSMGGQIAQLVAATSPERVEGLVGVLPVPASGLSLPDDARASFRSAGGNAESLGRILDMASPGLARPVRDRLLAEALRVVPGCVTECFDSWSAGGFADRLDAVRAPVLVVASDDGFLPAELLREQVVKPIRGARLVKLDGAGHYLPNEQPRALATALEAFLAGLGDGSRS